LSVIAKGKQLGIPNYKNHSLIPILEKQLQKGADGWAVVAGLKETSSEQNLCDHINLCLSWFTKLCNGNK
jgi:hypothetical protein